MTIQQDTASTATHSRHILALKDLKRGVIYSWEEIRHLYNHSKYKDRAPANPVKYLSDIDDESYKNFKLISDEIRKIDSNIIVIARGSRTNQNHLPDSDYDIIVYAKKENWELIKKIIFPVKVDMELRNQEGYLI